MPKIRINQFNGGLDEDVRSHNTTTFKDVKGFDTLTYKHRLTPYGEAESEALSSGSIADKLITDVVRDSVGFLAFMGRSSSGSPNTADILLKTSGTNVASTIESEYVDSVAAYLPNSFVFFRGNYYYILGNGSGAVRKSAAGTFITSTAGSFTFTSAWSNMPVVKPYIHVDGYLYLALGNKLGYIDNTATFTEIDNFVIPDDRYITGITSYGYNLAIATAPAYEGGTSKVYIYDQDSAPVDFVDVIDFGTESLLILENLGGKLIGISGTGVNYSPSTSYDVLKTNKIIVREYSGGSAEVVKELVVNSNFSLKEK